MDRDFELYRKRIFNKGISNFERMNTTKKNNLLSALARSYNAEDVKKNDVVFRALINDNRQSIDADEKYICTPFENDCCVGDVVNWIATNSYWLIMTQDLTEKTYFRGNIRKAAYKIRWRGSDNKIYETYATTKGPIEKSVKQTAKEHLIVDSLSSTITAWIGLCDGHEYLKQYGHLMIAGRVWKINNIDNVTTPGLLELDLSEVLADSEQDNKIEQIARDYNYITTPKIQDDGEYKIIGLDKIDPIIGLTQVYTLESTLPTNNGKWSYSSELIDKINTLTDNAISITFSGNIGITRLAYTINDVTVAEKNIKITSILG